MLEPRPSQRLPLVSSRIAHDGYDLGGGLGLDVIRPSGHYRTPSLKGLGYTDLGGLLRSTIQLFRWRHGLRHVSPKSRTQSRQSYALGVLRSMVRIASSLKDDIVSLDSLTSSERSAVDYILMDRDRSDLGDLVGGLHLAGVPTGGLRSRRLSGALGAVARRISCAAIADATKKVGNEGVITDHLAVRVKSNRSAPANEPMQCRAVCARACQHQPHGLDIRGGGPGLLSSKPTPETESGHDSLGRCCKHTELGAFGLSPNKPSYSWRRWSWKWRGLPLCPAPRLYDPRPQPVMPASRVRRDKAALSSGCKPHPATAPAGSNRSSHGGNKMAEAFGVAGHV